MRKHTFTNYSFIFAFKYWSLCGPVKHGLFTNMLPFWPHSHVLSVCKILSVCQLCNQSVTVDFQPSTTPLMHLTTCQTASHWFHRPRPLRQSALYRNSQQLHFSAKCILQKIPALRLKLKRTLAMDGARLYGRSVGRFVRGEISQQLLRRTRKTSQRFLLAGRCKFDEHKIWQL